MVNLPATVGAGDLIVVFLAVFNGGAMPTPSGWRELYDSVFIANSAYAYALDAVGNEDSTQVDFNSVAAGVGVSHLYHIAAGSWSGNVNDIGVSPITQVAAGTSADVASASNAGGSAKCLFIEAMHLVDDDVAITAASTNYTNLTSTVSSAGADAGCSLGTARRQLEAASDDPGSMTCGSSERIQTALIVIPPA